MTLFKKVFGGFNIDKLELARFDGKISGENVRYVRKSLGLSQTQFAELLRYRKGGQSIISQIETNKKKIGEVQVELLYWYHLANIYIENNAKTLLNSTLSRKNV